MTHRSQRAMSTFACFASVLSLALAPRIAAATRAEIMSADEIAARSTLTNGDLSATIPAFDDLVIRDARSNSGAGQVAVGPGAATVSMSAAMVQGASAAVSGIRLGMSASLLVGWASVDRSIGAALSRYLFTGFHLQEVTLRAQSTMTPYLFADFTLAATGAHIGFEEAFLATRRLPAGLTFRIGQMYAAMGKHNLLHRDEFMFLTEPLPSRIVLGVGGLNDLGASIDWVLPTPIDVEINLQAFSGAWTPYGGQIAGHNQSALPQLLFVPEQTNITLPADERQGEDLVYNGHVKTKFKAPGELDVEVGASYMNGRNRWDGFSQLIAGDLTLAWTPPFGAPASLIEWTTEYFWLKMTKSPLLAKQGGGFTALRYRFLEQWWTQARAGLVGLPDYDAPIRTRVEAMLAYVPSRYASFRLQYGFEHNRAGETDDVHEVFFQTLFRLEPNDDDKASTK